jgi:hypothetical protein
MAKNEIIGSREELERIGTFLTNNANEGLK